MKEALLNYALEWVQVIICFSTFLIVFLIIPLLLSKFGRKALKEWINNFLELIKLK